MKSKFPVKIVKQNNQFRATTSISQLKEKTCNIRQDLSYIAIDYSVLISTIQVFLGLLNNSKCKKNPRIFWVIGDYIIAFLKRMDQLGYYLVQQNTTLGKSIGISESSVEKVISFYKRFSNIKLIDPSISWAKYRDNKVPVPEQ